MKMRLLRRTTFTLLLAMTWLLLLSNAFSVAQDDTLEGTATAPDPPLLLTPAEGELTTGATHPPLGVPMLTWQSVISATTYEVQVSASSGFATTLARAETSATSYVPIIALGDGIFYWRVRAKAGYLWGEYSDVSSFRVSWGNNGAIYPVLLAPEDEAVLTAFAHTHFSWQPVAGAASYQFRIATDPQMTTAVYTALTTKPHHTPLQRLGNNLYYWQVTPVNNSGHVGVVSPIWRFTFDWSSAPQLLLPEDRIETPFAPRLSWTAVEGAKEYRLQISSQENFSSFDQIVTRNTDHTPVKALNNDAEYFWRVQAVDARSTASPWSQIWRFRMKWNLKPQLLSPTNSTIRLAYPFFAWAPVPGAEQYWIQIADNLGFNTPIVDTKIVNSTNHTQPEWRNAFSDRAYYWRVGAIDAQGNLSPWSDVWSFQFSDPSGLLGGSRNATAPNLVYPPPYYAADAIHTPVHSDRSIGVPFFIWDVAHVAGALDAPNLVEPADIYQLEVDDDPGFASPNFTILTAGTSAAPTAANPFVDLQDGAIYFWRVTAYRNEQEFGSRLTAQTRYSSALAAAAPAQIAIPELIYPDDGFEAVRHPPLLGWQPVTGAAGYHVQIARDATFSSVDDQAVAQFPHYTPWQGQLTPMPFGAYWWRVQAVDGANAPIGDWSAARHFNLSVAIAIGNPYEYVAPDNLAADTTGRALVAKSPEQQQGSYELRNLYTIVDRREGAPFNLNQNWVIAFTTGATSTDTIRYALYLDTDHVDGSGAPYDPLGNTAIVMDSRYRPEYVVYIDLVENVGISALFYAWGGANWLLPGVPLANMGGIVEFDATLQSVQLFIPYTALGSANDSWVGSLAISAYSLDGNAVRDSVPLQGAIADNPVFVSNMLLPLFPFDTPFLNPTVYDDLPPLRWQMPAYGADGYQVQVALDSQFTQIVETWESYETGKTQLFTLIPTAFQSRKAYANNESYYWRVRARHEVYSGTSYDFGPWSPAMRFKLNSRRVGNPRLSTGDNAFMTPTFLWDRVEGASGYTIQVDDDANFSSPLINQATDATSFTPPDGNSTTVLLPGVQYYWRVVMRRTRDIIGHWSDPMTFTKTSASPQPVAPLTGAMLNHQPTLQWTAVLTPSVQPRLAAPAYRVQIADNPAFNPIELDETTQSTSYTPPNRKLLADGVWYWRVAFVDGAGKLHPFSPAQSFTKEYLLPVLIEPGQGETTGVAPALTWGPIDGAAKYKLEYADNSGYNNLTIVTTELTKHVPIKAMTNSPYFWRVQMIDADGNPGPVIEGRFMFGFKVFLPSIQSE
jgi:hypothetical protein